ncbi:MAG: hypothetical protein Q7R93_04105 [bacterium]|nr:hypothetical protein [bacterium]
MNIAFYRDAKTGKLGAFITKETLLEEVQRGFLFHGWKNKALEVVSTSAECPEAIKALEALARVSYSRGFDKEDRIADALELLLNLAVEVGQRYGESETAERVE